MKTKTKIITSIIAFILSCVIMFTLAVVNPNTNEIVGAQVRTVELSQTALDAQSVLNKLEDVELKTEGTLTSLIGYQTLDAALFEELDLVSVADDDNTTANRICYKTSYDTETDAVTLTAVMVNGFEKNGEEIIIDTMKGDLVADEDGNFDVVFVADGEVILLSELADAGLIENCGLFSRIKSCIKKVWNTTAGKIGTIVTVAACAVVGVVCAVVPGGQLMTAVLIGAAVGAIGAAVTAGVASLEDNTIDWKDVVCFAGVGAVVGAATAAASFKLTSAIKNLFPKATPSSDIKCFDSYSKFKGEYGKASDYINNGEWHHIVEQQTVKNGINPANSVYNSKNTVAISQELHTKISAYYSSTYTPGQTFRQYINTLTYEQQYAKGLEVLKMFAEELGETIIWL